MLILRATLILEGQKENTKVICSITHSFNKKSIPRVILGLKFWEHEERIWTSIWAIMCSSYERDKEHSLCPCMK
jgi:hypothetical protein